MKAILAGILGISTSTWAADPSKDEAKAMVLKAVEFYKKNGKEKSLLEFSKQKSDFVKGSLYLTVWDLKGTQIAHGANPKLIGQNLLNLKDTDGKEFVKEFMEISKKGSGWVDYKWMNPETKKNQMKSTYLEKVEDTLIGAGVYQ